MRDLTPLQYDMTDRAAIRDMEDWKFDWCSW